MIGPLRILLLLSMVLVSPVGAQHALLPLGPSDLNPQHPLAQGLMGWYLVTPPLAGGPTWYSLVRPQPLTLTNMGAGQGWRPTNRSAWWGEVAFVTASSTYAVGAPNTFYDFLNTTFTVHVRFKATVTGNLVAKRNSGGADTGGWFLRVESSGQVTARIMDQTSTAAAERQTVGTGYLDGRWHTATVVLTTDSAVIANNDVTLYLDGVLDQGARTDSGSTGAGTCTCGLALGARSDGTPAVLTGSLDDVRLWQRRLTVPEIVGLAQSTPPDFDSLLTTPLVVAVPGGNPGSFFPFFR